MYFAVSIKYISSPSSYYVLKLYSRGIIIYARLLHKIKHCQFVEF